MAQSLFDQLQPPRNEADSAKKRAALRAFIEVSSAFPNNAAVQVIALELMCRCEKYLTFSHATEILSYLVTADGLLDYIAQAANAQHVKTAQKKAETGTLTPQSEELAAQTIDAARVREVIRAENLMAAWLPTIYQDYLRTYQGEGESKYLELCLLLLNTRPIDTTTLTMDELRMKSYPPGSQLLQGQLSRLYQDCASSATEDTN